MPEKYVNYFILLFFFSDITLLVMALYTNLAPEFNEHQRNQFCEYSVQGRTLPLSQILALFGIQKFILILISKI